MLPLHVTVDQEDHDTMSNNVTGSFPTDVKDEGDKANGVTSPPNDAIICAKKGVFSHS